MIGTRLTSLACRSVKYTCAAHRCRPRMSISSALSTQSVPLKGVRQDYDFNNLVEMQIKSCEMNSNEKFLGTMTSDGFEYITFGEFAEDVNRFRGVLSLHGVNVNDKVALISNNRVEWAVAYYAVNSLGAQVIPMYEAQQEKDWKYIIEDSEAEVLLVATERIYDITSRYINNFARVKSVICFDAESSHAHSYKRLMNNISDSEIPAPFIPPSSHLTTVMYTSGTTGRPKGVNLTHGNIVSNLLSLKELWGEEEVMKRHDTVCFIPWSHIFGLTCSLHSLMAHGSATALVPSRDHILTGIEMVKPTHFAAVPLLLNRLYNGVHAKFATFSPAKKKLIDTAFRIARERNHNLEYGLPVSWWLDIKYKAVNRIVMSKIRGGVIGGRVDYLASGGSALNLKVLQFFEDIGMPIMEGYGLTETSPVVTTSPPGGWENRRLGCVGVPIPGVTVLILDPVTLEEMNDGSEGEICVAGDNVTPGYRNNQEANDKAFITKNGMRFFRSGDLGCMVDGKFLKLTGRVNELYKLENGKFVMPSQVEAALGRSNYIDQCCVVGANREYNIALVVPDFAELEQWISSENIDIPASISKEDLLRHDAVVRLLNSEIIKFSDSVKHYERINTWVPVLEPFSQENEMLTAKMSLRRNNILKNYTSLIEDVYTGKVGNNVKY
mmetsp:Transcript_5137/g.7857  ORF Transcript_5137/g.7857 Transcript_5137/m.7857 type:complete len:666 (-) Transcript_5137:128-2125(-)